MFFGSVFNMIWSNSELTFILIGLIESAWTGIWKTSELPNSGDEHSSDAKQKTN